MINLSDTQRILLSHASQRPDESILPLPANIALGGGATKAIAALVKRGFAEQRETSNASATHRQDGELRYGVFITTAGATAIGVEPATDEQSDPSFAPVALKTKPLSKTARVLVLLARPEGATLAELIELTGWLPHTTRAALTGIRKKGHDVIRTKRDGVTRYHSAGAA